MTVLHERYLGRDGLRHWAHTRGTPQLTAFINGQKPLGEIRIGRMVYVDATDFAGVDYPYLNSVAMDFIGEVMV